VLDGTTIKVTGESTASNDYSIYFEVEEGATGDDLIDGEFIITFISDYFPVLVGTGSFMSNISDNSDDTLTGIFSGLTRDADNTALSLTAGIIDIGY
jgi:hypothetical protein